MQAAEPYPDWHDAAAYAPLLEADRSLIAWEWLRRDEAYRAAVPPTLDSAGSVIGATGADTAAAPFGLVAFENPDLAVPHARPQWLSSVHPLVLTIAQLWPGRPGDIVDPERLRPSARIVRGTAQDHLLLCDGLRTIRIDAPVQAFAGNAFTPSFAIAGVRSAERSALALRRFASFCHTGSFAVPLHPRETRARRWILMLRAWDALAAGAGQREIAAELLNRSAADPNWRVYASTVRSQVQRLVRGARVFAAGEYRTLLS